MVFTRKNVHLYLAAIGLSYVLKFNTLKSDHIDMDKKGQTGSKQRLPSPSPAPYSTYSRAIEERQNCNYSVKISTQMAREGIAPRKIRIYVPGIFDLVHNGHAECFRQAKHIFPLSRIHLIVGVTRDNLTHAIKGVTVQKNKERTEFIRHIRYVDEVIADAPWGEDQEFLEEHKIDFVAHDEEPYGMGSDKGDLYADKKAMDMFVATRRTEGISTTEIITRILKRYQEFVKRNLKRGVSKADLNVENVITDQHFGKL